MPGVGAPSRDRTVGSQNTQSPGRGRAAHDLWPGDTTFVALVNQIFATCLEFDGWWSEHGVGAPVSGTKRPRHPTLGDDRYEYASFQANVDPALKLALYTRRRGRLAGPATTPAEPSRLHHGPRHDPGQCHAAAGDHRPPDR